MLISVSSTVIVSNKDDITQSRKYLPLLTNSKPPFSVYTDRIRKRYLNDCIKMHVKSLPCNLILFKYRLFIIFEA